ncbi:hypothetical protein [Acuticoccus yangtzensis]|uniref:hypothetical protein n=1 Tax=Acuticoccus yangtzensis TaxID=1443441 RepID=UPI0009499B15|nr:hypothetical protein [Acuticoccus yangtzensis]
MRLIVQMAGIAAALAFGLGSITGVAAYDRENCREIRALTNNEVLAQILRDRPEVGLRECLVRVSLLRLGRLSGADFDDGRSARAAYLAEVRPFNTASGAYPDALLDALARDLEANPSTMRDEVFTRAFVKRRLSGGAGTLTGAPALSGAEVVPGASGTVLAPLGPGGAAIPAEGEMAFASSSGRAPPTAAAAKTDRAMAPSAPAAGSARPEGPVPQADTAQAFVQAAGAHTLRDGARPDAERKAEPERGADTDSVHQARIMAMAATMAVPGAPAPGATLRWLEEGDDPASAEPVPSPSSSAPPGAAVNVAPGPAVFINGTPVPRPRPGPVTAQHSSAQKSSAQQESARQPSAQQERAPQSTTPRDLARAALIAKFADAAPPAAATPAPTTPALARAATTMPAATTPATTTPAQVPFATNAPATTQSATTTPAAPTPASLESAGSDPVAASHDAVPGAGGASDPDAAAPVSAASPPAENITQTSATEAGPAALDAAAADKRPDVAWFPRPNPRAAASRARFAPLPAADQRPADHKAGQEDATLRGTAPGERAGCRPVSGETDPDLVRNAARIDAAGLCITHVQLPENGATFAFVSVENRAAPEGPIWYLPHDDEDEAFDAALRAVTRYGGRLVAAQANEERLAMGADLNRMFAATAADARPCAITDPMPNYTAFVMGLYDGRPHIFSTHNNTDGGGITADVWTDKEQGYPITSGRFGDADNLIYIAGQGPLAQDRAASALRVRLNGAGLGVVYEKVTRQNSDCSFSNHVVLNDGRPYYNVEAEHDSPVQGEMVERLLQILGYQPLDGA